MPKIDIAVYKSHSGPRIKGALKYTLPHNPQTVDGIIYCMTKVEGGKWDNINMFDNAGVSISILQWTTKSNHVARLLELYKKYHLTEYINESFVDMMLNDGIDIHEGQFVHIGGHKELTQEEIVDAFCPFENNRTKKAENKSKKIALAAWKMCRNSLFQGIQEEYAEWQIKKYLGYKLEKQYGTGKRNWQVSEALGVAWNYIDKALLENLEKKFEDARLMMFYFGMNVNAPSVARKYLEECIDELGYKNIGQVNIKDVYEKLVDKCFGSSYGAWGESAIKRGRKPRTQKVLDVIDKLYGEL